jgi:hypothetical protein
MPTSRSSGYFVIGVVLATFGFLCWRASLPNSSQQGGMGFLHLRSDGDDYFVPRQLMDYENTVTVVTARNFARHGFAATHFLPDRGGHPLVSLYDRTGTQCISRSAPQNLLPYWNMLGTPALAASINNPCIYTHYPPLADWIFGAMAALGWDSLLQYKLLVIAANCGWLLLLFVWLRRQVHPWAAATTVLLAASLPAFLQWGDTLYYHSFQFLFLGAFLTCWHDYLARSRRRYLALAWLFYFLQAACSFQLTFFIVVAALGTHWVARPTEHRARIRVMALLALAPCVAFVGHQVLVASYAGWNDTFANLLATWRARVVELIPGWGGRYSYWIDSALLPLASIPVAILLWVATSIATGRPWRTRLLHLAILLVAGLSFLAALPGTTSEHAWMMYRHLMPFALLLIGFLADAVWAASRPPLGLVRVGLSAAGVVLLGIIAGRNLLHVQHEIAWNRLRNLHENPTNLVNRSLEVLYWNAGKPTASGNVFAPITGIRDVEPPGWHTDLRLVGPQPSHYEIWWADRVDIGSIQFLVDSPDAEHARRNCHVDLFDERDFAELPPESDTSVRAFEPGPNERWPTPPRSWLRVDLPRPVASRAMRLTCSGHAVMPLRQVEAYADARDTI